MSDKQYNVVDGTSFDARTSEKVVKALQQARKAGIRVRLFMGDTKTGRVWAEENDVCGRISRSMGPVKVPILLNNHRSRGGHHILDHCIVGVLFRDRANSLQWLYRHPKIDFGEWTYHAEDVHTGERAEAKHNGVTHARFDTMQQAYRYCQFMKGERMSK